MIVGDDGQVLYAEPGIGLKLQTELPSWAGGTLDLYLPCKEPLVLFPHSLAQAVVSGHELSCALRNGLHLMLSLRECTLGHTAIEALWEKDNPDQSPYPLPPYSGVMWMVFGVCEDHRIQQFQNETKMRATIGAIIAGFAHEVRNPLAAILSLTEGVIHPQMDEDTLRALSRIPFLVERIENLIKTALSYGKPRPPQPGWHKVGTLLQQSVDILFQADDDEAPGGLLPDEGMSLPVFADQDHVISVVTNLIQNAIQEVGKERVKVLLRSSPTVEGSSRLYCRTPVMAIDVIDRGGGIPGEIQDTIFEPFFTTKSDGTGLGLAFARELARLNEGEVLLLESSDAGSIFRLYLPTHNEKGRLETPLPLVKRLL